MTPRITGNLLQLDAVDDTALAQPPAGELALFFDSSNSNRLSVINESGTVTDLQAGGGGGGTIPLVCEGRLTLTSGTPITTSDVTAATTIYFTPYKGNRVSLYDGSAWQIHTFTELSLSLSGLAADSSYDIFLYNNSGTLTLTALAWTNRTTRATALALQNGVYCQTASLTRRYLGTFSTTGTIGQTEDSLLRRYLWNYYNRTPRALLVTESADSWTYSTTSYRSLNNNTNNRVQFVIGVNEEMVTLRHYMTTITQGVFPGIALDATNANNAQIRGLTAVAAVAQFSLSEYRNYPGIGYHYLQLTERGNGSTATIYGDAGLTDFQMGGIGEMAA